MDGNQSLALLFLLFFKKEDSKSCPLCREKIPPSKDILVQLEYHRRLKRQSEAMGDTSSGSYMSHVNQIKRLETEIGDYEGEGLDYDGCIELPQYIVDAVKTNNIKRVLKWLGSPVDMKRLNARYPRHANASLVQAAIIARNSDLLSILLQYGADVNAMDAAGCSPLFMAIPEHSFERAR